VIWRTDTVRQPNPETRFSIGIAEGLLFIALAVLSTMPLVFQVHTHLAIGAEPSATVPLLNLWTLGWNVDRLGHGYQGYWDAPIYYPTRGTFALCRSH
jgi:hypothetical protein